MHQMNTVSTQPIDKRTATSCMKTEEKQHEITIKDQINHQQVDICKTLGNTHGQNMEQVQIPTDPKNTISKTFDNNNCKHDKLEVLSPSQPFMVMSPNSNINSQIETTNQILSNVKSYHQNGLKSNVLSPQTAIQIASTNEKIDNDIRLHREAIDGLTLDHRSISQLDSKRELNLFNQNFKQSDTHISHDDHKEEEIKRLQQLVKDLTEQVEQYKDDKDNLRSKIKSMETICVEITAKKNKCHKEMENAVKETKQFRDDVAFLTNETSQILDDLQKE